MGKIVLQQERGAVAVIVAIFLSLIIGLAALVIDFGFAVSAETELQEAADAAALAAVSSLDGTDTGLINAKATALTFAGLNSHTGSIGPVDVEFGIWIGGTFTPSATAASVDAVQVSTRTTVNTMFDSSIASGTIETGASAVAKVVGSLCSPPNCQVDAPIVICDTQLNGPNEYCSVEVQVAPTRTQDGGLTSFFESKTSVPTILDFITNTGNIPLVSTVPEQDVIPESCYYHPDMQDSNIVSVTEGTQTPIFFTMQEQYDIMTAPCEGGGTGENCGDVNENGILDWETTMIIAWCSLDPGFTLSQGACVKSFANFYIEEVCAPTDPDGEDYRPCVNNPDNPDGTKAIYGFAKCAGGGGGLIPVAETGATPMAGLVR